MIKQDIIYGVEEIKEKGLIELINSRPIQRLKGVSQFGMPDEYYHKQGFSRYEHSMGVLILLRRLGAGLEEQVAGLLHDVSHTAFSHVIDWVMGDSSKEDYQDKTLPEVLKKTELKNILDKNRLDYKKIADLKKFSLLEQPAPSLCADRVDYTLREIALLHNLGDAKKISGNLMNFRGRIIFSSIEQAKIFSRYYINFNREHWGGNEAKARFYILANTLKRAINQKVISLDDLMQTDKEVLNILEKSDDKEILSGLEMLKKGFLLIKPTNGNGILLTKKFRHIDPEIIYMGKLALLSELSPDYKKSLEQEIQNHGIKQEVEILPLK